ncbi:MAG: NTP/NDP exchange transporter [Chlamydiia bacterium]|nr:NTP/NDP exchange transporter [Chlamydiia bacterium]
MTPDRSDASEFSGLRKYLWPVHGRELKKFLPMFLLFFLIFFDYNVLRTMKDALVVTAKSSGAEVIPFIKVWVMFPGAVLMTFIFTRLSNRFSFETVFYLMMGIFLSYFFIFAFFAYPIKDQLHLNAFADSLETWLPVGLKGLIAMVRYWLFTSFYVMSELWSPIILSVLFWGFANQVTRFGEAKRFYGLFGIGANISGAAAGALSYLVCLHEFNPALPYGNDAWEQSMVTQILIVLLTGIIALIIFRWLHLKVLSDPTYYEPEVKKESSKEKIRLSMRENFRLLFKNPYLMMIAIIVVSYNLVINLTEVVWKHEVKALYPNPQDYNMYMGEITFLTSIVATIAALLVSGNSVRFFGWRFTALMTPVILFVTSLGFFGFMLMQDHVSLASFASVGGSALAIAVFFGSAQNVMSRAAKYSVFDATKEMAFVPLSPDLKIKGKAAIDGVGSRLGKSGGSLIHQSLLLSFSGITASAPYVAVFLLAAISVWIAATWTLGKQFKEEPAHQEAIT